MNREVEKNRKRRAFAGVLLVTLIGGALLFGLVARVEDGYLLGPIALFALLAGTLGAYALSFVWIYERVLGTKGTLVDGIYFGLGVWMVNAFPILLFLTAAGVRSIEAFLTALFGSIVMFVLNGTLTAWFMEGVAPKSLEDRTTEIG